MLLLLSLLMDSLTLEFEIRKSCFGNLLQPMGAMPMETPIKGRNRHTGANSQSKRKISSLSFVILISFILYNYAAIYRKRNLDFQL